MYFDGDTNPTDLRFFNWMVVVAQVFGLLSVVLVAVWMGHYQGGFAWQSDPTHQFNLHPLFMIIGMVFLYADGILAYRVFRNEKKLYIKIVHAVVHVAALVFVGVGMKAVFDFHNLTNKPNLYSLHSWVGLFVVVAFGLQWLLGFLAYLTPVVGMAVKRFYMPYHRFWGAALLALSGATVLMGITENAIFKIKPSWGGPEGILVNFLGVFVIAFVVLVIYLVTKPEYKRPPAPEEDHIPLNE
ncbi:putative transmembrane ascorbate-dependent reductase CYB561 homolog [Babylonia areolata]|uniref:putative transmembrane ascorbate-dependent reductase CYB561 homolog n=1 Tax=Babylonia areolata TaxID=304850 RepID=UPI003FD14FA6